MNKRRKVVIALGAGALVTPFVSLAQTKFPVVVGWLNAGPRQRNGHYLAAFKEGMADLGWKEGTDYVIEERWADSAQEKLQPLAIELAAKKPTVVLAATVGADSCGKQVNSKHADCAGGWRFVNHGRACCESCPPWRIGDRGNKYRCGLQREIS
jgi:putative ABC transport system substrate-binding protein